MNKTNDAGFPWVSNALRGTRADADVKNADSFRLPWKHNHGDSQCDWLYSPIWQQLYSELLQMSGPSTPNISTFNYTGPIQASHQCWSGL